MIAFATTCKGRAQHIKATLPQNLADNPNAKFILVDYASGDDLREYLQEFHCEDISSGRLVVYSYTQTGPFRMAHAKNLAHRLAIREGAFILINLDADNLTGPRFDRYVETMFRQAIYDRAMFGCPNIFLWARMIQGQMK